MFDHSMNSQGLETNNPNVVRVMVDDQDVTHEYIVMKAESLHNMAEVLATHSDDNWWETYVALIRLWTDGDPHWTTIMEKFIDEGYGYRPTDYPTADDLIELVEKSRLKDILKLTIIAMLEIAPPEDYEVREARLIQWIHEHPDSPATELLQYTHSLVYGERV